MSSLSCSSYSVKRKFFADYPVARPTLPNTAHSFFD